MLFAMNIIFAMDEQVLVGRGVLRCSRCSRDENHCVLQWDLKRPRQDDPFFFPNPQSNFNDKRSATPIDRISSFHPAQLHPRSSAAPFIHPVCLGPSNQLSCGWMGRVYNIIINNCIVLHHRLAVVVVIIHLAISSNLSLVILRKYSIFIHIQHHTACI